LFRAGTKQQGQAKTTPKRSKKKTLGGIKPENAEKRLGGVKAWGVNGRTKGKGFKDGLSERCSLSRLGVSKSKGGNNSFAVQKRSKMGRDGWGAIKNCAGPTTPKGVVTISKLYYMWGGDTRGLTTEKKSFQNLRRGGKVVTGCLVGRRM